MDRQRRLVLAGLAGSIAGPAVLANSRNLTESPASGATVFEGIPIAWVKPAKTNGSTRLVIWLAGGIDGMETTRPILNRLASEGFVALSFDSWGRGKRATETDDTIGRVFANFPLYAWPYMGQGCVEVLRVLDWAANTLVVSPPFAIGGFSLGGDLAVAAAGLDSRMTCVAAAGAAADWTRPGMQVDGQIVKAGTPDAYARFFYDRCNPMSNLEHYAHRPAVNFECGADDRHIPATIAKRFVEALQSFYLEYGDRLRVSVHAAAAHEMTVGMLDNCVAWFNRFARVPS